MRSWPRASTIISSCSPSASFCTRIGRRRLPGRKPNPLAKATARGRQRRHPGLHALSVAYLPVKNYPELSALGVAELEGLAIGHGGTALCLEARDLHVSIAGLVSASQPLMDLAATVIAVRNGSRRTEAKAQASRENGRKGGRPRKAEAA